MSSLKKFVSNKWFLVWGTALLVFLLVVEAKQFTQRNTINKEITDLQQQQDSLQKKNDDLQNFIAYLKTDSYKEKVAREQLNLSKNGEFVYSFSSQNSQQNTVDANNPSSTTDISNAKKWWNYFFNYTN